MPFFIILDDILSGRARSGRILAGILGWLFVISFFLRRDTDDQIAVESLTSSPGKSGASYSAVGTFRRAR